MSAKYELKRIEYESGGWGEFETLDGRSHGRSTFFNSNGSKQMERLYINGRQEGAQRTWSDDGKIVKEQYFHYGVPHGPIRSRNDAGVLETVSEYRYGVHTAFLDRPGNPDFMRSIRPNLDIDQVMTDEQAEKMLSGLVLPACCMTPGAKTDPGETAHKSFFGLVNLMARDEVWPEFEGCLLSPILQIDCQAIPIDGHPLKAYAYVTLFALPDEPCYRYGQDFVLRVYRSADELCGVTTPDVRRVIAPSKLEFETVFENYPHPNDFPAPLMAFLEDRNKDHPSLNPEFPPRSAMGGWPRWIQFSQISDHDQFLFQVGGLEFEDWDWGDFFLAYFFMHSETGELSGYSEMY